jgi:hypothetical protein
MADSNYDDIRRRVEKRFKERQELLIHFAVFVIANLGIWLFWLLINPVVSVSSFSDGQETSLPLPFPWPLIVTLGWGIGMVSHFLSYYYKYGGGAERREQAIEREIERELVRREDDGYLDKPKRDQQVQLTEDGELEAVNDEEVVYDRRKGNGR